jgi:hypothetical protein
MGDFDKEMIKRQKVFVFKKIFETVLIFVIFGTMIYYSI